MKMKKCLKITLIFIFVMMFVLPINVSAVSIKKDKSTSSQIKKFGTEASKNGNTNHHRLFYNYDGKGLDADIYVYEGYSTKAVQPTSGGSQKSGDICHPFSSRKLLKSASGSYDTEVYCVVNEQWFETDDDFKKCSAMSYNSSKTMEDNLLENVSSKVMGDSGPDMVSGLTGSSFYDIVGEALKIVDTTLSGEDYRKIYLYKTAISTTALGKSRCRYSSSSNPITGFLKSAVTKINNRKTNIATFKKLSISRSSQTLNKSNGFYISGPITISGIMSSFSEGTTQYALTSNISNGSVSICTKSNGSGCTDISNFNVANGTYYVRVNGATTDDFSFTISMNGSVKYTRNYGTLYCNKGDNSHSTWQPLFRALSEEKTESASKTITLTVPDYEQRKIQIKKVNTDGEAISGGTFTLREQNGQTLPLSANSDRTVFEYSFVTTSDTSNKKYCIAEVKSPDGYVLREDNENCYDLSTSGSSCVALSENSTSTETVDSAYCNSQMMCPGSGTWTWPANQDLDSDGYYCKDVVTSQPRLVCEGDVEPVDNKCTETPVVDDTTGESTCPGGGVPEGGVCYKAPSVPKCDEGTLSGESCVKDVREPAICKNTVTQAVLANDGDKDNEGYGPCKDPAGYAKIEVVGGNFYVTLPNEKNTVNISKRLATGGDDEIPGAKLKVCTKAAYQSGADSCTAATTVDHVDMEWTSGTSEKVFEGVPSGTYYIIETLPPSGFKVLKSSSGKTTATEFFVSDDGKVTSGAKTTVGEGDNQRDVLIIGNEYNAMSISKTDIATSKELPGATISICRVKGTYASIGDEDDEGDEFDGSSTSTEDGDDDDGEEDSDDDLGTQVKTSLNSEIETDMYGNCVPAKLADGSLATWVSTDKPHAVEGLPAGTYYLVELTAPNGYTTAEAIKFVMKEDGTLTDADGNSLKDSRIVMKDKPIVEVKTGDILLLIITAFGLVGLGFASYYYFNNKKEIMQKIRRFGKATS